MENDSDERNSKHSRVSSKSASVSKSRSRSRSKHEKIPTIKSKVKSLIDEKNSSKIFIPGYDGPLVSLSLFNELQHNILPTDVIESSYKEYKHKYEQKKLHSFYVEHQHDEWFKEKYDHELNLKWKKERVEQCKKMCEKYIENIQNDSYNELKLELKDSVENNRNVKILTYGYSRERQEFEEKERDVSLLTNLKNDSFEISNSPYFGFDPDKMTLFLHQIPRNVSRWQILDVLKKLPGFNSMSLSEPIKNQSYFRYCWVTFDSEENCDLAYESLNDYKISSDYKISPIKSKSSTLKKIRLTPPYYEEAINEDLENSKQIILLLNKEKEIDQNIDLLFNPSQARSPTLQLDLQILFLRKVHAFCYYCLEEHEDERMLATKCDNIHLRSNKVLGKRSSPGSESNRYENEWDKNFSRLSKEKIEKISNSLKTEDVINEEFNKRRNEYCKENTSSISPERFICKICSKMFKGPNFVYNHIFNKHINLIQENVDKDFNEKIKYESYLKDHNKISEKFKIISSMEEYLGYLNTIKNFQQTPSDSNHEQRKPYNRDRDRDRDRDNKDRKYDRDFTRRKRNVRDYRDLDDPESTQQTGNRQLISYDDL